MHYHMKTPDVVKLGCTSAVKRVIRVGHSKITRASRKYCHLFYFGAVFFEGHGLYSIAGGVLLGFGLLAIATGEDVE